MADELRRAALKTAAVLRAQKRCEQALEYIDWKIDVLEPTIKKLKLEAASNFELPEFVIEDEES